MVYVDPNSTRISVSMSGRRGAFGYSTVSRLRSGGDETATTSNILAAGFGILWKFQVEFEFELTPYMCEANPP
jgi:hypothetical protein